jgi:hypothetical protein
MKLLENIRVQISAGIPRDHLKLAIPPRELDRALLTLCMALVRAGATIVYGGDLRPDGFAFKIFRHLARAYADVGSVPFVHIISHASATSMTYAILSSALKERRGTCRTYVCAEDKLYPVRLGDEEIVAGEGDDLVEIQDETDFASWLATLSGFDVGQSMTGARGVLSDFVHASVSIGGKMGVLTDQGDQYFGTMPGIVEEALLVLAKGKPMVPIAAYGGATRDLAISLGLLDETFKVPRGTQLDSYGEALIIAREARRHIPSFLTKKLEALARDDRAEVVARDTVDIIHRWLQPQ